MNDATSREAAQLEELGERFLKALERKDQGDLDTAEDELAAILKVEPRLPEPRMELARILLDTDRLDEAEEQARTALDHLENSGPWTDMVPEDIIRALSHALLAEVLRRRADEDDVIFGDPEAFKKLLDESRQHFEKAAELDPSDEYASYHAFFLGVDGHGGSETR